MPEPRDIPLVRWGEELRRRRRARRSNLGAFVAGAALAVLLVGLLAVSLSSPRPALIWNASASSPLGLYRVMPAGGLAQGDMVAAWPPSSLRALAARRHYLPANVPLIKRVAAVRGDRVCAVGESIFVNGHPVARRLAEDPSGRPLPWWAGCHELGDGAFLLMPGGPASFDGRYFGITEPGDIVGRARRIWTR